MILAFAVVVASVVGSAVLSWRRAGRVEAQVARVTPSRFGPARLTDQACLLCELERQEKVDAGWRRLARDVFRPGDDL